MPTSTTLKPSSKGSATLSTARTQATFGSSQNSDSISSFSLSSPTMEEQKNVTIAPSQISQLSPDSLEEELLQSLPSMARNYPLQKKRRRKKPQQKQQTKQEPSNHKHEQDQEPSSTLSSMPGQMIKKKKKKELTNESSTSRDSHSRVQRNVQVESLLTNTARQFDSEELNEILGIRDGHDNDEMNFRESVSTEANVPPIPELRHKNAQRSVHKTDSISAKSAHHAHNNDTKKSHRRHVSDIVTTADSSSRSDQHHPQHPPAEIEDDDQTIGTLLGLLEMKERFQEEFPGQDLPSDDALRQRYRNRHDSPIVSKPTNHKKSRRPQHPSNHNSSKSPITKPKASVKTLISNERWGNSAHESNSSLHASLSSKGSTSGFSATKGSPSNITIAQFLERNNDSTGSDLNHSFIDPLSQIPILPFSDSNERNDGLGGREEIDGLKESRGDSERHSTVSKELPPIVSQQGPSAHKRSDSVPTEKLRDAIYQSPSSSAHQPHSGDAITAPNTWTAGGKYHPSTASGLTLPSSADGATRKKTMKSGNSFLKNKLRSLLNGKDATADRRPLMLLDDSENEAASAADNTQDPIKHRRSSPSRRHPESAGTTTDNQTSLEKPRKNWRNLGSNPGGLLSSVLGIGGGASSGFGELECSSSDDDTLFIDLSENGDKPDHKHIPLSGTVPIQQEMEKKDVTDAMNQESSTTSVPLNVQPRSLSDLSKTRVDQDLILKQQVEEATIATRRNRRSNRHRSSQSPDTRTFLSRSPSGKQISKSPSHKSSKASEYTRLPVRQESLTSRTERHGSQCRVAFKGQDAIDSLPNNTTIDRKRSKSLDSRSRQERHVHDSNGSTASYTQPSSSKTRYDRRRATSCHDTRARKLRTDDASGRGSRRKTTRSDHRKNTHHQPLSSSTKLKSDMHNVSASPLLRRPSGGLDDLVSTEDYLLIPTHPVDLKPTKQSSFRKSSGRKVRSRREVVKTIREKQQQTSHSSMTLQTKAPTQKMNPNQHVKSSSKSGKTTARPLLSMDPALASSSNHSKTKRSNHQQSSGGTGFLTDQMEDDHSSNGQQEVT